LKQWFPTVTAHFSDAIAPAKLEHSMEHSSTAETRTHLTAWLRDQMVNQQFRVEMEFGPQTVPAAIVETARDRPRQIAMEDATRQRLSYRRLLVGADLLARPLDQVLTGNEEHVGVLLPNVNALPALMLSLWRIGKVPAILNFSTGAATMLACAQLAGLK